MDPQSAAFTPGSSNHDIWRLQGDVGRVQQVQAEHSERLARVERKLDDDARMKSVWGNTSPFPGVLSGTPQQAPLQHPPADQFRNFDDEANNLMSSLHLDPEEEPRRGMGAASRANSVRFDETANQGYSAHSSRPSVDYLSRTSSGLGGLQMNERSGSHKSDGRASSAHSMRSAASGRANSLTGYSFGDSSRSPLDTPGFAPGMLLLGSVPAIIRCWMNTNFKHDALLYAAVCTGSYSSYLDLRLIQKLGFEDSIVSSDDGVRSVQLPVYFPEAIPHPASSRSNSPVPQLPTLTVDFRVVESGAANDQSIQIFIGSDTLRAHSADILFSSNSISLFDDDRSKLSIPLVRPEREVAFKDLYITSGQRPQADLEQPTATPQPYLNGLGQGSSAVSLSSAAASPPLGGKYRPPGALAAEGSAYDSTRGGNIGTPDSEAHRTSMQLNNSRPPLSLLNTRPEGSAEQTSDSAAQQGTPSRTGSGPAIWSNWRTSASATTPSSTAQANASLDWAAASRNRDSSNPAQRRDTGMKVLKPKTTSRSLSSATSAAPATMSTSTNSAGDGRSRFFEEGKQRSAGAGEDSRKAFGAIGDGGMRVENSSLGPAAPAVEKPKTKSNPLGGASAFSWMGSAGGKK
ncbi:hypothetical protein MBLNU230_g8085t1 [Neophaeotheca triangularis]